LCLNCALRSTLDKNADCMVDLRYDGESVFDLRVLLLCPLFWHRWFNAGSNHHAIGSFRFRFHKERGVPPHALYVLQRDFPMPVRGIRGATTARANTREAILDATRELLEALVQANALRVSEIASAYFTMTPDLDAAFPASAARAMGWNNIALLDAQAPRVMNDVPRCIRVLIHWNTDHAENEIRHVYLHEARGLRSDRAWGD